MTRNLNSTPDSTENVKFLYSYGGRIDIRHSDGKLRYVGGYTRVLSVDPSVSYAELMVKFGESCGFSVNLKCKLPSEDLDVLISVKSDEDLRSVIGEYRRASPEAKIRAVLFPIKSEKKVSPPSSPMSCFDFPSAPKPRRSKTPPAVFYCSNPSCAAAHRSSAAAIAAGRCRCCQARSMSHFYLVPRRIHSH
ncbi:uncharacterized protein LOC127246185 [Andrographis paniculata]|uniref:uncharacterized protein LOC127246185 n=1 Tax=Andrographis paniculata TaxID=175694 RepID=UPI0021E75BEF|nr:uncharacterized protein LOC127246185 [Andrographis paniculata]